MAPETVQWQWFCTFPNFWLIAYISRLSHGLKDVAFWIRLKIMRLYNKDMVIYPKLRNFNASCWPKLDTEVTEVFLHLAYTFIRNCVIICNHSWICTYVFLWNASPCQVLIIHRSKTLRCGLSSRYISTDRFNTRANAFLMTLNKCNWFCTEEYTTNVHIHSQIHFLYVALAEIYTYV